MDQKQMADRMREKQRIAIEEAKKRAEREKMINREAPKDPVKPLAQALLKNLKEWVIFVKNGGVDPRLAQVEREIGEFTKQLFTKAPTKEDGKEFAKSIKQILTTGKTLQQNPSTLEDNGNKLGEDLKLVIEKLKPIIDPRTARAQLTLSPPPQPNPHNQNNTPHPQPTHNIKNTFDSSLNSLTSPPPERGLRSRGVASAASVGNPTRSPGQQLKAKKVSQEKTVANPTRNPSKNPSRGASSNTLSTNKQSSSGEEGEGKEEEGKEEVKEEVVEIPCYPSIEELMEKQEEYSPSDTIPWGVKYLMERCELDGGRETPLIFSSQTQLAEEKLLPLSNLYQLGNLMWVKERNPFLTASLLRRFFWHLPEPFLPDKAKCVEMIEKEQNEEVVKYLENLPPYRASTLVQLIRFLKKFGEDQAKTKMSLNQLCDSFASCLLRCSSNYQALSFKKTIPEATSEEKRFFYRVVQVANLEKLESKSREGIESLLKMRKLRAKRKLNSVGSSSLLPSKPSLESVEERRKELREWKVERYMENNKWLLPKCNRCNQNGEVYHQEECSQCKETLYRGGEDRKNLQEVPLHVKLVKGYLYETGCSPVTELPPNFNGISRLEEHNTNKQWYRDFFASHDHLLYLAEDKDKNSPGKLRVVVVENLYDNPKNSIPQRVLVLSAEKGFTLHTIDSPTSPSARKKALSQQIDLLHNSALYLVEKEKERESFEKLSNSLLDFEKKSDVRNYKFGILYQKEEQSEENEMYSNFQNESPLYNEFLEWIGERIVLANHKGYRGGLDCRGENTTGVESVYTSLLFNSNAELLEETCSTKTSDSENIKVEIMFHVATLLPYTPENPQQLHKKRHLGNDVIIIVFNESSQPFNPSCLASQFNHVFVVVSPMKKHDVTSYSIQISCKSGVKPVRPCIRFPGIYKKSESFRKWLLLKCINCERGAMYAKDFSLKMIRTREKVIENYIKDFVPASKRITKK